MKFMKVCEVMYLVMKDYVPVVVFLILSLLIKNPPTFIVIVMGTIIILGTIYVVFGGKK